MRPVFRVLSVILLILLPFLPLPEFYMGDVVENKSLVTYLVVSMVIIVAGYSLARMMGQRSEASAWILLSAGLLAIIPLHMGPPHHNENHLSFDTLERTRFAFLLLAVLLASLASFMIISQAMRPLKQVGFLILLITVLTGIWDQGSSILITSEFQQWVDKGGDGKDFFDRYNYRHPWRSVARAALYALAILVAYTLHREGRIKTWTWIVLAIFSLAGVVFCILAATLGQQFYAPFMVPAVALAPLYWTGLAMLFNRRPS